MAGILVDILFVIIFLFIFLFIYFFYLLFYLFIIYFNQLWLWTRLWRPITRKIRVAQKNVIEEKLLEIKRSIRRGMYLFQICTGFFFIITLKPSKTKKIAPKLKNLQNREKIGGLG